MTPKPVTISPVPRLVILLKAARGYHVVDVREILYAEADTRYCKLHFVDGSSWVVFHTLSELEGILCCGERMGDLLFTKVHRGYIVALHYAHTVDRTGGVKMCTGCEVPMSRGGWTDSLKRALHFK